MKKNSFSLVAAMITLALAGGAASAAGCGGVSTASLCEDICACERCTTNDLEACQAEGDKAADAADAAGCSSQFDDAVACSSANVNCNEDRAVTDGCDAELTALTKCSSTLSAFGQNACELAADLITAKFTSCGGPVPPSTGSGTTPECTDALGAQYTCLAACFTAADCTIIVADASKPPTAEQTKAFLDCITKCQ